MDLKQAEEHAALVARDVVARGIAPQDAVRKAYFEYLELIRKSGVRGTFPQLLIARGVADKDKLLTLASARPPSDRQTSLTNSQVSMVGRPTAALSGDEEADGGVTMQIPPNQLAAQLADAAKRRTGGQSPPPAPTPAALTPPPPTGQVPTVSGSRPAFAPLGPAAGLTSSLSGSRPAYTPATTPGGPDSSARIRAARTPAPPATTPAPPPARPAPPPTTELEIPPDSDEVDVAPKKAPPPPKPVVEEFDPTQSLESSKPPVEIELEKKAGADPHRVSSDETMDEVKALLAKGGLDESEETEASEGSSDGEVPEVPLSPKDAVNTNGEPNIGARLGQYEVLAPLGRGGMAVVFRVKDTKNDRELAMKVLTGGDRPGGDKRRARFRREVRAVMRLDHPNIVKIHDSARSGPLDFYVMDLVEGEDFEKALAKGKYDLEKRLEIVEGIVRAMAHAHERGVVHRDLKPQNVLLDARSKPKVVDFGLAKVKDDEVSLTRTNTALGTPFYMAPEQHKNAKGIDHRADVFALGVILYEVAAGHRPFTGETAAEVGHKVLTLEPPFPSSINPEVKPQIDAIIAKSIEKDPLRRYETAGKLLIDLIRARAGKEIIGAKGAAGLSATVRRLIERNRAAFITGVVVVGFFLPLTLWLALRKPGKVPGGGGTTPGNGGEVVKPDKPVDPPKPDKPVDPPKPTDPLTPPKPTDPVTPPKPTDPGKVDPPKPTDPGKVDPPKPTDPGKVDPPKPDPAKPLTPLETARADVKIPEEGTDSGADTLATGLRTPEQQLGFLQAFDRMIELPLARGEVDVAKENLEQLGNDPDVAAFPRIAKEELGRDLELLSKLRRVVIERIRADSKLFASGLNVYDVGRTGLHGPVKLVEDDTLELGADRTAKVVIEPLALATATLRTLLDKEPDSVKIALSVLSAHRGEEVRSELKPFASSPYVLHRMAWLDLLKSLKDGGIASLEKPADELFKGIEADRAKNKIGNIESVEKRLADFLKAYGRFEPYRSRRADWLMIARDTIPWEKAVAPVVEDKSGKTVFDIKWNLTKNKHVRDLELACIDPQKRFRADFQAAGIMLENASLTLPLEDRTNVHAALSFVSPENEPVTLFAGDKTLDFTANAENVLKDDRGTILARGKSKNYRLNTTRVLDLTRMDELKESFFLARLKPDDLFKWVIPKNLLEHPQLGKPNRLGAQTADRARFIDLELFVAKAPGIKREAEARVHERDLIEARAEYLRKGSRSLVARKDRELIQDGTWNETPNGLEGAGPGSLNMLRESADAEATFDLVIDDGPGALIELVRQNGTVASWLVPGSALPVTDPPTYRKCIVTYELTKTGSTATCILDEALRLESKIKVPTADRVSLKVTLIGRTKATIKSLKVMELSRSVLAK